MILDRRVVIIAVLFLAGLLAEGVAIVYSRTAVVDDGGGRVP